ncbi:hypothetical protein GGI20_004216 [Coemansia sp. BCRC 34301]|nr:hypothetical protein GGI20_004216 [Coemansia sp. BCRC 34301]
MAEGRAPLVSLTVSVVGNSTGVDTYQATFDRSDYAYPLPQTGLSGFGFAGEVYVPESAECADEIVGQGVRQHTTPAGASGVVLLPYRSCRDEWAGIVRAETQAGRAGGAILYSMKDDAAQAAERMPEPADMAYVHVPVWVVNAVAGAYLASVLDRVNATGSLLLPAPPPSVVYGPVQDDVRMAVRAATGSNTPQSPRVFVTISRSAADVASADRNFFLKAMIGVGITGIVCFFVAMVVRYFDCLRVTRQRRHRHSPLESVVPVALHHIHHLHHHAAREKRVLLQHELDAMPCSVVALPVHAGPVVRSPPPLRQTHSCPHLALPHGDCHEPCGLHRVSSVLHHCKSRQAAEEEAPPAIVAGGWDNNTLECAICLDEIHVGHVIRNLPCPHVFHAECIDRWLLCQSSTCPLCKRDTLHGPPT